MVENMIFITGGAFQGKEEYVRKQYQPEKIVDAGDASEEQLWESDCILNYHRLVRKQVERGEDALSAARKLASQNPRVIITMDEVGSGVIPLDKTERVYRKEAGRTAVFFAKEAKEVYRMVCGIPQNIG